MFKYLVLIIIIVSCQKSVNKKAILKATEAKVIRKTDTFKPISYKTAIKKDTLNYTDAKREVILTKHKLKSSFDKNIITLDSVSKTFTVLLINKIIPHWYGTSWDFNGHTNTPNKGKIACGYFVSTTLKHMGLKLNRYKLAQKGPKDEADFLSCGIGLLTINNKFEDAIINIKKQTSEGIYFIGFNESHVGYLLNKNNKLYLIHSNFLEPSKVIIEQAEKSDVFKSFENFYITPISNNKILIKKWLNDKEL